MASEIDIYSRLELLISTIRIRTTGGRNL